MKKLMWAGAVGAMFFMGCGEQGAKQPAFVLNVSVRDLCTGGIGKAYLRLLASGSEGVDATKPDQVARAEAAIAQNDAQYQSWVQECPKVFGNSTCTERERSLLYNEIWSYLKQPLTPYGDNFRGALGDLGKRVSSKCKAPLENLLTNARR
jgi:hypothetical protein